ncbi:hypothetical protein [Novosphingobium mathurense]|uniref:Uncharacterized protein n=1 Tax=Novosphingobium mathurense TaxID=428990 RepID=A0A1U6GTP1_9SPHN|nr:hypothetical protein [Novosphingobium mathurense]SLJ86895.1 hypothetical protein SAMN06295987_101406 [Novosphingobium mathurense]
MVEIQIPELLKHRAIRAVMVEGHDLAGSHLTAVTVHIGCGRKARRQWFSDRGVALAHAAEMADQHALPLFDLGMSGEGE